jgi:queuine/archaeosine tRNA-ribosyltransferase
MKFYIGCYNTAHLKHVPEKFIYSFQQLRKRKSSLPVNENLEWIMDSGAFQEIRLNGKYTYDVEEYKDAILMHEPDIFVNMDWMCEPNNLEKTGKAVREHQKLSTANQVELMNFAEDQGLCFMGTIQGWKTTEYIEHIQDLKDQGILTKIMGIGSICRRGSPNKIIHILRTVKPHFPNEILLHGFGVKTNILNFRETYDILYSCDSMAWSYAARKAGEQTVGIGGSLFGKNCLANEELICYRHTDDCANCERYMLKWLHKIESKIQFFESQTLLKEYV